MICEYCKQVPHHPHCPLAHESKSNHYCFICQEGIFNGEEYIENDCGEYAHWECVDYGRDLVEFLGYEIKTMEEED